MAVPIHRGAGPFAPSGPVDPVAWRALQVHSLSSCECLQRATFTGIVGSHHYDNLPDSFSCETSSSLVLTLHSIPQNTCVSLLYPC